MYSKVSFLVFVSIIVVFATTAQASIDTLTAKNHLLAGDSLIKLKQAENAIWHYRKAGDLYFQAEAWQRHFESLNKLSMGLFRMKKYNDALAHARHTVKHSRLRLGHDNLAEARAYSNMGITYQTMQQFDSAVLYHKKAVGIKIIHLGEMHPKLASSYYHLGLNSQHFKDYVQSLGYFTKVLNIEKAQFGEEHVQVSDTYSNIAKIYFQLASYNSALDYYKKSLSIRQKILNKNDMRIAGAFFNIGLIHVLKGDYVQALDNYNESRKVYEMQLGQTNQSKIALLYNQIGTTHLSHGSYNLALEYLNKALEIWKQNYGERHIKVSYAYNNIGLLYEYMGQHGSALEYLRRGLSIKREVLRPNHEFLATSYDNIGLNFLALGNYDSAIYYTKLALKIQIENYTTRHPDVSFSYTSLGHVQFKQGNYSKAIEYHKSALEIRKDLYGTKHPDLAASYNNIAAILNEQKDYGQALLYYQHALRSNLPDFDDHITMTVPVIKSPLSHNHLITSFYGKAIVFEKISNNADKVEQLLHAFTNLQICDTIIDHTRRLQLKYADKLEVGKAITSVYESGIRIALKLYKITSDSKYQNLIFHFAEKSKSEILSNSISNISAKKTGLLPDSLINIEQTIKIDKSYFQSKIVQQKSQANGYDTAKFNYFNDQLFQLNRKHDSLVITLEKKYPRYHQLKYKDNTINISELQRKIPANTALIEYFVGDSSLYSFTLTKEDFNVFSTNKLEAINETIDQFREVTDLWREAQQTDSSYLKYVSSSQQLYDGLIKNSINSLPKNGAIKNLIIIPDGKLSYIPFELLIAGNVPFKTIGDYSSLDYLIKNFNISYAYSSTINYQDKIELKRTLATNSYLGFAPVYENVAPNASQKLALGNLRDAITNLEWNQKEIEQASQYMGGDIRLAQSATESTFKQEVGKYNIVHLAMHALINDEDPMLSKLVFTPNELDTLNDGYLHTYELFNMEMNPDLVVLSACNTGYGKLEKGEGINSLAYAFAYAGCPSIVMSQWQVDDKSTSELITHFYKNISDGMDKSSALRYAKLEFLKDPGSPYANPSYWGGFVLIGDTSPVDFNKYRLLWYILMGVMGVVVVTYLYYKVFRSRKLL